MYDSLVFAEQINFVIDMLQEYLVQHEDNYSGLFPHSSLLNLGNRVPFNTKKSLQPDFFF